MNFSHRRPADRASGRGRGSKRPTFTPRVDDCEARLLMSVSAARHPLAAQARLAGQVRAAQERTPAPPQPVRNVIIFVADGLRPGSVNPTDAPTMTALKKMGVNFVNSHAVFPTFTTPNAAAIATGHYPGDTGDFSNTVFANYPVLGGTNTPFLENNPILGDIDEHFGGNFLDEDSLLSLARQAGYNTAAVGKVGPVLIQDVTQGNPSGGAVPVPQTVIIDDSTGRAGGIPLSPAMQARMIAAGVSLTAPDRTNGAAATSQLSNGNSGTNATPGTLAPNSVQQQYFADATTKAILPAFAASGAPFAMVFWSRDPDGTQHNQGDSLGSLTPGINGPTSRAAVRNADNNLKQLLDYLKANPRLARTTDVFVTSDHGFSTISRNAADASDGVIHDYASTLSFSGVNAGFLPPGFVAIDIAHQLNLPIFDPDATATANGKTTYAPVDPTAGQRPRNGDALIGGTGAIQAQTDAKVVVAANGGSDLIYVPDHDAATVRQLVDFLGAQDYTSGLFVDDAFGSIPGTLPLSSIGLKGTAQLPTPSIVINFKTFATDANNPYNTGVEIADSGLQQGQGMHGSFGRQDTYNTMIAYGPDFRRGLNDPAPASNADVGVTMASILGVTPTNNGTLTGRVLNEALQRGYRNVSWTTGVTASAPSAGGRVTYLNYQRVGDTWYYDAAGYAGRTNGLATSGGGSFSFPSRPNRPAPRPRFAN